MGSSPSIIFENIDELEQIQSCTIEELKQPGESMSGMPREFLVCSPVTKVLRNNSYEPIFFRNEREFILREKARFDDHQSNFETPEKMETSHSERSATKTRFEAMMNKCIQRCSENMKQPGESMSGFDREFIACSPVTKVLRNNSYEPIFFRNEREFMLREKARFDDHQSNFETPEKMETSHLERSATKTRFEAMMDPDVLRIALIGKTGTGKSSLCKTLIGERLFPDSCNFQPLFERVESMIVQAENSLFGRNICLVDTPGLFDTRFSSEQVMYEIRRCISLTTPGPHAIILTVKASRLTKEDIEVFETYTDMFGESMLKYTVVVFTHFDHWKQIIGKTREEAIEDFIKSFPETVNQFLKRIKNRYIMVDTKGKDVENETKALIFAIQQMLTDNENGFYSYQHIIDSMKHQLRAEGLVADENRRQKKKKNRRQLTSSFRPKTMKRTRSCFERETGASMVPDSKRRYNCRA